MQESEIRQGLRTWLAARPIGDAPVRIVEELGVWSNSARIDLAVIGSDLYGLEIKSAQDTLKRLPWQIDLYGRVFDRIDLVLDRCHLDRAIVKIPEWWGVMVAVGDGSAPVFERVREAHMNPSPEPEVVCTLLWRDEILDLLRRHGLARGCSKRAKPALDQLVAASFGRSDLTRMVCETLRARQDWRTRPVIAPASVGVVGAFAEAREAVSQQ